jgi:hypothetical protein
MILELTLFSDEERTVQNYFRDSIFPPLTVTYDRMDKYMLEPSMT